MLQAILGLDPGILARISPKERTGYRLVVGLFLAVCLSILAADAYFGHMFSAGPAALLGFGSLLAYIHFAFYRLALITLTTRPLAEKEPGPTRGWLPRLQNRLVPDAASLFRLLFVSLIAMAVSFPGSALFYHRQAEEIQAVHREKIMAETENIVGAHLCSPDSRFPFLVFESLWKKTGFRLLVLVWIVWIFSPLVLLTRLRYGPAMEYSALLAAQHRNLVERDYQTTVLEALEELKIRFPEKAHPAQSGVYEDPPFNTRFRNRKNRNFGDHTEFAAYLNSLPQG